MCAQVGFQRLNRAVGRLWRKFLVDECPDEKERKRSRRIENIMHDVVLLEAMRRWELENKNCQFSKDDPITKG